MTGDELRAVMLAIVSSKSQSQETAAVLKLLTHEEELAAALDDRDRLEWLEQAPLDAEGLINLVGKWTWDGKRHLQGLSAAIDSARGKS